MQMRLRLFLLLAVLVTTACGQHYVTPGPGASMATVAGVDIASIEDRTEPSLKQFYKTLPASYFPANLAVVRVQDAGYRSHSYHRDYGQYRRGPGRFTVVTTREIESEASIEKISNLAMIRDLAPIGRMLVPASTNSIRDLRIPAAQLHADMLLVYTVDTAFDVAGKTAGPMSVISLGLLKNKTAHVSSTVSGMLVDVRTGHVYGTLEATETRKKKTNVWSSQAAVDSARIDAERAAFEAFTDEFADFWRSVAAEYTSSGASRTGF